MASIEKRLAEWVQQGLISEEQSLSIASYEAKHPKNSWVLSGLLIYGALVIGIGIISLIAANWYQIPDFVKLFADFALLGGLSYWILKSYDQKKFVQFEVILLFFMVMCLASIGLISQIYHTGGMLYQALFLWALITAAAALASKKYFVPFFWMGGLLCSILMMIVDSPNFREYFGDNYSSLGLMVTFFCAIFALVSKSVAPDIGASRAFRYWTIVAGYISLGIIELSREYSREVSIHSFFPSYFLCLSVVLGVLAVKEYKRLQKSLLFITIGLLMLEAHFKIMNVDSELLYAVFTILILSLIAIFVASLHERRIFQYLLTLVGVRVLILYFQAIGSLAQTGIGLIISGCLIIGCAVYWNKYKSQLADWIERKIQ